jgi:hypothetical protein
MFFPDKWAVVRFFPGVLVVWMCGTNVYWLAALSFIAIIPINGKTP